MLPTREAIEVVADVIERHKLPNVVIDTVIRSTSGYDLIDGGAIELLIKRLLPLARIITPNLAEAERLTGLEVKDLNGMKRAAQALSERAQFAIPHRRAVLIKGGHLSEEATDVLEDTYSTASKGCASYGLKVIETTRANSDAAFDLMGDLMTAKSYSEMVELYSAYLRKQFDALVTQAKELSEHAQKVAADMAEPIKESISNGLKKAA